jgi:hypothetical protein
MSRNRGLSVFDVIIMLLAVALIWSLVAGEPVWEWFK